jgi:hypothetical protein
MNIRRLDAQNDYVMGRPNGRLRDAAAVAQLVVTNLLLAWGEWFLDPTSGVSWYDLEDGNQAILGGHADQAFAENEIKRVILSTTGVAQLLSFSLVLDHETRRATVAADVVTVYSETVPIEVALP